MADLSAADRWIESFIAVQSNGMKLWRKLTVDWPCALGDWLWTSFVVAPAAFLNWLTVRRAARIVLQIILFVALLVYFEQIAALHLASLFAVDANAYLDLFVGVFFLIARGHMRQMLQAATRKIWQLLQSRSKLPLRFGARRRRDLSIASRKDGASDSKQPDDEPSACSGAIYTFA